VYNTVLAVGRAGELIEGLMEGLRKAGLEVSLRK